MSKGFFRRQVTRAAKVAMPTLSFLFAQRSLDQRLRTQALVKALSPNVQRTERDALAHIRAFEPAFKIDKDLGFGTIKLDPKLTAQCIEDTKKRLAMVGDSPRRNTKEYLQALTSLRDYEADSPVFKLATDGGVVSAVSKYLDGAPVLWSVSAMYSPPSTPSANGNSQTQWKGSQFWHRDSEDIASVKVWILCSDVEINNGPTFCLPRKLSDKVGREIGYNQGEKVLDDRVFKPYENEMFSLVGETGATFTTDTCRCFHMGSRTAHDRGRLVLMFNFVSRYSLYFWPAFSLLTTRKLNPKIENLNQLQKDLLFPYYR